MLQLKRFLANMNLITRKKYWDTLFLFQCLGKFTVYVLDWWYEKTNNVFFIEGLVWWKSVTRGFARFNKIGAIDHYLTIVFLVLNKKIKYFIKIMTFLLRVSTLYTVLQACQTYKPNLFLYCSGYFING